MVEIDAIGFKIRTSTFTIYVLSLFFATATAIVLIAELLTNQVSNASQNAEDYNAHEKLFHLCLQ